MKLLVLMGGKRVSDSENKYPLYLYEVGCKLIIEIILDIYNQIDFSDRIFCVKSVDIASVNADDVLKNKDANSIIVNMPGDTAGAICSALLASEYIDNSEELLIVSVDDYIDVDVNDIITEFRNNNADVGVVSFTSIHPRYSFVRKDLDNNICEITEKKPISKDALASFYYFKRGEEFVECAKNVIRKNNRVNDSFYVSQALNEMILLQKKITVIKITNDKFHSFKNEIQLANYINSINNEKESV